MQARKSKSKSRVAAVSVAEGIDALIAQMQSRRPQDITSIVRPDADSLQGRVSLPERWKIRGSDALRGNQLHGKVANPVGKDIKVEISQGAVAEFCEISIQRAVRNLKRGKPDVNTTGNRKGFRKPVANRTGKALRKLSSVRF